MKIFMMSSVHAWNDSRIFHKEAVSLAKRHSVELYGIGDFIFKEIKGVKVFGLPRYNYRRLRILNWLMLLRLAMKSEADVFHFHDPELIPLGLLLKLIKRKKVIYDVHEDFPASIMYKEWIPNMYKDSLSKVLALLEKGLAGLFDAILLAEFSYADNFRNIDRKKIEILNYPLREFVVERKASSENINLVYAGSISEVRGVFCMIKAVSMLCREFDNVRLFLIGPVVSPAIEIRIREIIQENNLMEKVTLAGRVPLSQVYEFYSRCHLGLILLHPERNYLRSLGTKIFEYMAAGLPVVASNFPLWEEFFHINKCGVTVDPLDPKDVAKGMKYLISNPNLMKQMGENGKRAYLEKYNWDSEEEKLFRLYSSFEEKSKNISGI